MMKLSFAAAAVFVFVAAGCSSSTTSSSSGSSGSQTPDPAATTDPAAGTADSGTAAAAPKAPTLTELMKMGGALHVNWTNNDTCDSVEGERQAQMADGSIMEQYKVVFTVPGTADNKMDGTATDNMKYTYRLRCKKAGTYSDYSNTMSANPTM